VRRDNEVKIQSCEKVARHMEQTGASTSARHVNGDTFTDALPRQHLVGGHGMSDLLPVPKCLALPAMLLVAAVGLHAQATTSTHGPLAACRWEPARH
jgi:hypothetical protein